MATASPLHLENRVTRDPLPGSRKVYVEGSLPGVRVPMREVRQSPTRRNGPGGETLLDENPPVVLYDTSGPFTDPAVTIDLRRGLAPLREAWIRARADVEAAEGPPSPSARAREHDARLALLADVADEM